MSSKAYQVALNFDDSQEPVYVIKNSHAADSLHKKRKLRKCGKHLILCKTMLHDVLYISRTQGLTVIAIGVGDSCAYRRQELQTKFYNRHFAMFSVIIIYTVYNLILM